MFRRVWAGFLSLLVILGTLAAAPEAARAAMSEEDYMAAARQLNKYGLVQGDDRGYRFYSQITRAEMAKLLVYSLGLQNEAPRQAGRGLFADTAGHWADGVITLAKTVGIMQGYPEGDFRPQAPLTNAEVITALSRLVGLEGSGEPWPRTYLIPAQKAGIIPDQMRLENALGETAARGDVFVLLWRTLSEVKNAQGQNLLRRYLDTSAPTMVVDPQPKETSDLALTVSGTVQDAERVLVNGESVIPTFGYFREDVSLRIGPNTIRIQAVDAAGNVREEVLQVTRKQSPVQAVYLTGPSQVPAGQTIVFNLTPKDQNGETVVDKKGLTAEVQPPGLGTFDVATGIFTAGRATGQGTILVKAGAAQVSAAVTVIPGPLDRLAIDPAVAEAGAQETVRFTARGFDAYGNPVTPSALQWTSSGGTVSAGAFTAPVTAGMFTVTASADGKTATATVQPPNFKAAGVRLAQPTATTLRANGISEMTITATVVDAQGNALTDYKGSLLVSSSAPGVASPTLQSVPVTGGVALIPVRAGITPGTAQIRANTNLTVGGTTNVTVAPQRLQAVRLVAVSLPASTTNANPTGYVEAIALDEDGHPIRTELTQTLVVQLRLTSNGPAGNSAWFTQNNLPQANIALGPIEPATGDVRTRTHLQYTAGIGTFLVEGTTQGTGGFAVVYPTAMKADQVGLPVGLRIEPIVDTVVGTDRDIFVVVLDANGYRVTQPSLLNGIVVTLKDQNEISYPDLTLPTDGPGRYRFRVRQSTTGQYTYFARLQPANAIASQTARVVSGALAGVRFTATPAVLPANNSSQTTLRAELVDGLGNRVTEPAYRITFTPRLPNNGAFQSFAAQTVTSNGGVAEAVFKAGTVSAGVTVDVVVEGTAFTAAQVVSVQGMPYRLQISYGDNNGNGVAGEPLDNTARAGVPITVFVDVYDEFNALATYDHGRQITLTARNLTAQNQQTGQETVLQPISVISGRATFQVQSQSADTFALKAQSPGLTQAVTGGFGGSTADARFTATHAIRLDVKPDLPFIMSGGGNNYARIRATLVDAGGNLTTNQSGMPINITLQAAAESNNTYNYGKFTVDETSGGVPMLQKGLVIPVGGSVSNEVKFFSGGSTGTKKITWTGQDGSSGDFTVTTVAKAAPSSMTIVAESMPTPGWNLADHTIGQVVTITLFDASGKRASDANGEVEFTIVGTDAQVVSYWNPATKQWVTLQAGGDYPNTARVVADRGQVLVKVATATPGVKLYRAQYPVGVASPLPAEGYGTFYAN